jgi:hypothetical protein
VLLQCLTSSKHGGTASEVTSQSVDVNNPHPRSMTSIALINMQMNEISMQITSFALINMEFNLINMYDKIDLIPIEINNLTVNKVPDSTVSIRHLEFFNFRCHF